MTQLENVLIQKWAEEQTAEVNKKAVTGARSLSEIGKEIQQECADKKFYFYAAPYVEPMLQLNSIYDNYYADSAASVVRYALGNLTGWKGEKARAIKAELNSLLKNAGL